MLRFLLGIAVGFLSGYLYGSERAREEARRRLAEAQEPMRQATERAAGVIAGTPLPDVVKQGAARAVGTVQSAGERAAEAATPAPEIIRPTANEVAGRPAEPLPRIEP